MSVDDSKIWGKSQVFVSRFHFQTEMLIFPWVKKYVLFSIRKICWKNKFLTFHNPYNSSTSPTITVPDVRQTKNSELVRFDISDLYAESVELPASHL